MSDSLIAITEGSGKNERTNQRVVGANTVEETYVQLSEPANPTFQVVATAVLTTTSADHLVFIMADGVNYVRIKRIFVEQSLGATTATLAELRLYRVSTAGSGGTAITARGRDAADSYSGTIQTLPSSKGTEGVQLLQKRLWLTQTIAAQPNSWEWLAHETEGQKPIIVGVTATDGVALKIVTGIAVGKVDISITFTTDTAL